MKNYSHPKLILMNVLFLGLMNFLPPDSSYGQCFTPTINEGDTIICSGESVVLSTQPYDNYQWFYSSTSMSIGSPIGGETNQTYTATGFGYYTVQAKLGTCIEYSNTVLVDEHVFQYPYIISQGQTNFCTGDSTLIEIGGAMWTNIQWYQDGNPILGATNDTYWVEETGNYVVSAYPQQCQNIQMNSGVGPSFTFHDPVIPSISFDGTIITSTSASSYQWNLDQTQILGATSQTYTPVSSGFYTVTTVDSNGCDATSDSLEVMLQTTNISENSTDIKIIQKQNEINLVGLETLKSIELYSISGAKIKDIKLNTNIISLDYMSKGVYLLIIKTQNGELLNKKIIIQ